MMTKRFADGDQVEMMSGARAKVIEVYPDEERGLRMLVLEFEDGEQAVVAEKFANLRRVR